MNHASSAITPPDAERVRGPVISPGSGRSGAAWFQGAVRPVHIVKSSYSRRTLIGGRWFQVEVRSSSSRRAKTASSRPYDTGARYGGRRSEGWLGCKAHYTSDPVDALEQVPRVPEPRVQLRRARQATRAGPASKSPRWRTAGGGPQFPPPVQARARVHQRGDRRVPAGRESRRIRRPGLMPSAGVSDWQTTRRPVRLLMSTRFPIAYDARGKGAAAQYRGSLPRPRSATPRRAGPLASER
jgi:hypothetical protein